MDTRHKSTVSPATGKRQPLWRQGHHFGIRCCALAVAIVLLINVITLIVAVLTNKVVDGIIAFEQGDCTATKRLSVGLHLLINLLGTTLLGASNYCMQCVSAPTRNDIDKAHRQRIWIDIGISSIRNSRQISWPRKAIWFLLVVSSVPLHLTYNSVIFPSTSNVDYAVSVVTKDFLGSNVSVGEETMAGQQLTDLSKNELTHLRDVKHSLTDIGYKDCIDIFGQLVVSNWKELVLVSSYEGTGMPIIDTSRQAWPSYGSTIASGHLVCASESSESCPNETWSVAYGGCLWATRESIETNFTCYPFDHCLAEKAAQHCSLRLSIPIMIAVIMCNIIKLFSMIALIRRRDSSPLVTLGDAVSSFLDNPG